MPMTKKQLYIIIGLLFAVLVYVIFMPVERKEVYVEQEVEVVPLEEEPQEVIEEEVLEQPGLVKTEASEEVVVLEGIFVGFVDGADVYKKKYKYMLLNDGIEVLRIDLRPLVGYSDIDIPQKLGVERGDQVKITGVMNDGKFKIQSVVNQ
jgi:hypothetical protein